MFRNPRVTPLLCLRAAATPLETLNPGLDSVLHLTKISTPRVRGRPRKRAKKPRDAPRRPKSAYMFFLAEFREAWKNTNPEQKRVSAVAQAAGEKWRGMSAAEKEKFELLSFNSKVTYKREKAEYSANNPETSRKAVKRSGEIPTRSPSAFLFFLRAFKTAFEKEHPEESLSADESSRIAAEKWKSMTPEEKDPYERMSSYEEREYHGIKETSNLERMATAAELAFAVL
eukprot:g878.t1